MRLAVIQGNAELLSGDLGSEDTYTPAILRASKRGVELTQRLLAFSRKQPLQPKAINLAAQIGEMSGLLQRSLGETIEIEIVASAGLWPAVADPGQVENAVLYLSINARDAMPGGGRLTIECANAPQQQFDPTEDPGTSAKDYVMLEVTDSGFGMSAEVLEHAFEPFFTTKAVGEGSGLGLSMVYGFAKQSGGHATIHSEEGHGTTVRLYLPRADRLPQRETAAVEPAAPLGRGECVLVIEDDPDVRQLAVKLLTDLGYRPIDVPNALEARAFLAADHGIDLILSDVVLSGGLSGPEFAEEVRVRYPDLKIIFMSGYPVEATDKQSIFTGHTEFLNKPFRRSQFAHSLRAALDGGAAPGR